MKYFVTKYREKEKEKEKEKEHENFLNNEN